MHLLVPFTTSSHVTIHEWCAFVVSCCFLTLEQQQERTSSAVWNTSSWRHVYYFTVNTKNVIYFWAFKKGSQTKLCTLCILIHLFEWGDFILASLQFVSRSSATQKAKDVTQLFAVGTKNIGFKAIRKTQNNDLKNSPNATTLIYLIIVLARSTCKRMISPEHGLIR
mgnify:CR=1 FL=1